MLQSKAGVENTEYLAHKRVLAKVDAGDVEQESLSTWKAIEKYVLRNRTMVLLALANVCVYALRYGILTWTPVYLSEVRHASLTGGIAGFSSRTRTRTVRLRSWPTSSLSRTWTRGMAGLRL